MTLDQAIVELFRNLPVLGASALALWAALPQLAERFALVAKLMRPFSKKARAQAQADRDAAERDRKAKLEEEERVRAQMLAEAQATAQTTATQATTSALTVINEQYGKCRQEVVALREVTGRLIDVCEDLLPMVPEASRPHARAAIGAARAAM